MYLMEEIPFGKNPNFHIQNGSVYCKNDPITKFPCLGEVRSIGNTCELNYEVKEYENCLYMYDQSEFYKIIRIQDNTGELFFRLGRNIFEEKLRTQQPLLLFDVIMFNTGFLLCTINDEIKHFEFCYFKKGYEDCLENDNLEEILEQANCLGKLIDLESLDATNYTQEDVENIKNYINEEVEKNRKVFEEYKIEMEGYEK